MPRRSRSSACGSIGPPRSHTRRSARCPPIPRSTRGPLWSTVARTFSLTPSSAPPPPAGRVSCGPPLPATLSLSGRRSHRAASIESTTFGVRSIASGFEGWSSWVDDGSRVVVDDIVVGAPGERFATRDATSWRVLDPMGAVVTYVHQFTATLHIEGLDGHQIRLAATSFGEALGTTASTSWSSWVDAGRDVSTDDMLTIGERERYRTLGR